MYNEFEKRLSIAEMEDEEEIVRIFNGIVDKYGNTNNKLCDLYDVLCEKVIQHQRIPCHERLCELYDQLSSCLENYISITDYKTH